MAAARIAAIGTQYDFPESITEHIVTFNDLNLFVLINGNPHYACRKIQSLYHIKDRRKQITTANDLLNIISRTI
jgi:hypothetical protein